MAQMTKMFAIVLVLAICLTGCVTPARGPVAPGEREAAKARALDCLRRGIQYPHNPAVRLQAVEAYEQLPGEEGLPWVRSALLDEHPGVRFAACMVLGTRRDRVAHSALRQRLEDDDPNVRVGALFALHRLGDEGQTGKLAWYLLSHQEPTVRRNAALVLGRLEEPGVVKTLARAMRDTDPGVRDHALEAMAILGNHEARQQLRLMANSGIGQEEVFALNALIATRDPTCGDLMRYKLQTGVHLETRLVAVRGLGVLGKAEGLQEALRAIRFNRPRTSEPDDPPEAQVLRTRQLAAAALGALGDPTALSALERMMNDSDDPRLQVAAAKAILEIISIQMGQRMPFATGQAP